MATKKSSTITYNYAKPTLISVALYVLTIGIFATNIFNITSDKYTLLLSVALIVSGIGMGYAVTKNTKKTYLTVLGTVAISTLIAFPLYFLTVFIGWTLSV